MLFRSYEYPGNVRELKNIVERVSVLSAGPVIGLEDLPADLRNPATAVPVGGTPLPLAESMARAEKQFLLGALTRCGNNRTKAAEVLGISRKNLWEKMKLHRIEL